MYHRPCEDCPHFEAIETRILIIKCRAQGDVLRTTPLLPGLKKKYPRSHISWLVDEESADLLHNHYIDRIHPFTLENVLPLLVENFDILISLDKEPGPISLATKIKSARKFGFGMNEYGNMTIFNHAAEYAYRLGIDDHLKFFQNKKTYQEIIHEAAEIPFERDEYVFRLSEEAREKARRFIAASPLPPGRPTIGLNTGAGTKFETKQWPKEYFLRLIHLLTEGRRANIFLFGGKRERELNQEIEVQTKDRVCNTGCDNSLTEFAGLLSFMDLVVSSDTLGMHLTIALKKKVVAFFGPTCPQEIDLYGRGVKLFSAASCSPCYKQTCDDGTCMKEITPERVFEEILKLIRPRNAKGK